MSTRARIAIEVTPEERKYIVNKYVSNLGIHVKDEIDDWQMKMLKEFKESDDPIISIYHHSDGYVEYEYNGVRHKGLGATLFEQVTSRRQVIELMTMGDLSTIWNGETTDDPIDSPISYLKRFGECSPPTASRDRMNLYCEARRTNGEYIYVFNHADKWEYLDVCYNADAGYVSLTVKG